MAGGQKPAEQEGLGAAEPWNHNVHYHRVILDAIPFGCRRALDVGCGQGALTRRLSHVVPQVSGIDRDERSIMLARVHPEAGGIRYVLGDFLSTPFEPESFEFVTSIAVVHHVDAELALRQMSLLLRPGGRLAVIGLARDSTMPDLAMNVPAVAGHWLHRAAAVVGGPHAADALAASYQSPIVWPPPLTYRQMRRLALRVLPGPDFRRRLYWRYSLVWTKPAEGCSRD